jgi:HEAT repeat protein
LEQVTEQITLLTFDDEDDALIQQLVACLADEREAVRRRLIDTLGEIGEPATGAGRCRSSQSRGAAGL